MIEARKIGEGDTGSSTGNLYSTIGSPGLHILKSRFDEERMTEVVQSRGAAVDFIEQRIQEFNIDCDFRRVPWCLFTEDESEQSFLEKEKEAAEKAGLTVSENIPFPLNIKYGFKVENQAQFNPLQYVVQFAKAIKSDNCNIYEHTKAIEFNEGDVCTVKTENGTITASNIVMATHTPKGIYFVHTS